MTTVSDAISAMRAVRPGMREYELTAELMCSMKGLGAEDNFLLVSASQHNLAVRAAGRRILEEGDVILAEPVAKPLMVKWPEASVSPSASLRYFCCVASYRSTVTCAAGIGLEVSMLYTSPMTTGPLAKPAALARSSVTTTLAGTLIFAKSMPSPPTYASIRGAGSAGPSSTLERMAAIRSLV